MLARVLEPEVMDTAEEARDYDAMDHAAVNRAFCADFFAFARGEGRGAGEITRVLDVGVGTARIPIEMGQGVGDILGIDLAEHMLAVGRENVSRAGLSSRITLARVDAKAMPYEDGAFSAVVSNSIVHHIPDPARALSEMWRVTGRSGLLFVRDLLRPPSAAEVERLVELHGGAPPVDASLAASFERQRSLFRASLHAALTLEEVAAMLAPLGISTRAVERTSDRHWTLAVRKPPFGAP